MTPGRPANSALETLIEALFDYSGTFPPASKSLDEAIRETAGFSKTLRRPWILESHLVVDEVGLEYLIGRDLRSFGFDHGAEVRLCVLAAYKSTKLVELLWRAEEAVRMDGVSLKLSSVEIKLTHDQVRSTPELRDDLTVLRASIPSIDTLIVLEPNLSESNWQEVLEIVADTAREHSLVGIKCRCTGPTAVDAHKLAQSLISAADREIPFKVTGGLHHPIVETARYKNSLGFLNLVTAVMLRRSIEKKIPVETIARLLVNEAPGSFDLSRGLSYADHVISLEKLREVKALTHFSIGSCSLTEPDDDLVRLLGCRQVKIRESSVRVGSHWMR